MPRARVFPTRLVFKTPDRDRAMNLSPKLNHPNRLLLAAEVHARPFVQMQAPVHVSHLAVFSEAMSNLDHHRLLASLCERFGVAAPVDGSSRIAMR